jgi:hypothetical protein
VCGERTKERAEGGGMTDKDNALEVMDLCTQRLDAKRRLSELKASAKLVSELVKSLDRQMDELADDEESGQGRLKMEGK